MSDDNAADEIARLESELEDLAEAAERCRKIILVAKIAMVAGGAWLLGMVLGLFDLQQVVAISSIAAVLGGIVASGSNRSTLQQIRAKIGATEARRAELIGQLALRLVGDSDQ
jgi:hypothetical protein